VSFAILTARRHLTGDKAADRRDLQQSHLDLRAQHGLILARVLDVLEDLDVDEKVVKTSDGEVSVRIRSIEDETPDDVVVGSKAQVHELQCSSV